MFKGEDFLNLGVAAVLFINVVRLAELCLSVNKTGGNACSSNFGVTKLLWVMLLDLIVCIS